MTATAAADVHPSALLASDRLTRDELLALQRRRLRALLDHAAARSPYYRELLGPDGHRLELGELPILTKATLMEEFDRIATDPRVRRAEVERHVARLDAVSPFLGRYRVFATSGSTGVHGLFVFTQEEFGVWVAAALRMLVRLGVTPETRLVAIGAPGAQHVTRQLFAAFRSGRSGSPALSVVTPLDAMVAALNEYRPEAIAAYPSIAALLAGEQLVGRLRIEPRIVAVGSEVLTADAALRIRGAWGIEPSNVYAATEAPLIAAASAARTGLHVVEDVLVLEAVDEHDRPVAPGVPSHKVLLTNLVNLTQPLVRYELSDSVVLAEGPDPGGLPYLRIASVDGRNDDVLRVPGRDGEIALHPHRLRAPFTRLPDVRQYS